MGWGESVNRLRKVFEIRSIEKLVTLDDVDTMSLEDGIKQSFSATLQENGYDDNLDAVYPAHPDDPAGRG